MADTNIPVTGAPASTDPGQPSTIVEGQAPATQADTTDLSTKFAHLARKSKSFREEQRRFQAERQAFESEKAKYQPYVGLDERISKDPLGVLGERGITQDQLASLLLNQSNPQEANHIFQMQQENKDLRAQIEKINKRFEDNDTNAVTQALNQIGHETKILISSNASDFELIGAAGDDGIEAVKALCKLTWDEDQVLMTVQEAAEQVEQELLERSLKLASANKVKAKLSPAPLEPAKNQPIPGKTQPTKTLNSQAAQATSKPLSAKERAILAFKGQL